MNDSDNPRVAAEQARDTYRKTAAQFEKLALDTPLPEACAPLPRRMQLKHARFMSAPRMLSKRHSDPGNLTRRFWGARRPIVGI